MNSTMSNTDAMRPVYPDLTNGSDNRNASSYVKALAQFQVATNPRYTPRDVTKTGRIDTFCNIFLWDGSRALGCEIPHFNLYYVKGPDGKVILSGQEYNANAVANWFAGVDDELAGWREIEPFDANIRACGGFPTVVIWKNTGGIGHVAWVVPNSDNTDIRIAQAGGTNFFNGLLAQGFGSAHPLKFYTHD